MTAVLSTRFVAVVLLVWFIALLRLCVSRVVNNTFIVCPRRALARNPSFVASFVGNFVDKAHDKDATHLHRIS